MKKPTLVNIAQFGSVLATRATGREAADRIQDAADSGDVVVSFHGVEIATPSFLDEVVLRVAQVLRGRQRILVLAGLDDEVRESLELVLANRDLRLAYLDDDHVKLLGGSKQLDETLRAAQELGSFKAPELAEQLRIKLPNLHQRLSALLESGALTRDAGAKRGHDYLAASPEDIDPKKLVTA
jgi:hypothetical protein